MKRMHWLDEYKDVIICLYNEGMKQTEIAKEFEVSQTAISTRLRKWGASNPDGNRFKRIKISKDKLYDLYWNKEMHPSQIAEIYDVHKQTVINKLLKYGIRMRTKSEARMGKLNPIYGVGHTKKARKKMSEAFANGRKMGYNTNWGKGAYYDTPNQGEVWMRSGWEVKVADYLTENGVDWYYEHEWLEIDENKRYLPDFFLPELNCYIEVKGRIEEEDLLINRLVNKRHKVLFWNGKELLKRGIIDNAGDQRLNRKYKDKGKGDAII